MSTNDHYWFRAKKSGLGWDLPLRWQGWLVYGVFVCAIAAGVKWLPPNRSSSQGLWFALYLGAITLALVLISYWKGEPSGRRRWTRK